MATVTVNGKLRLQSEYMANQWKDVPLWKRRKEDCSACILYNVLSTPPHLSPMAEPGMGQEAFMVGGIDRHHSLTCLV